MNPATGLEESEVEEKKDFAFLFFAWFATLCFFSF